MTMTRSIPTLPIKLLAYALDPAALDGEAETAAVRFIRAARRDGFTIDTLAECLPRVSQPNRQEPKRLRRPPACRVKMPNGKYAGLSLLRIAIDDIQYLRWIAE